MAKTLPPQNNLAIARYPLQDRRAPSLRSKRGIAFCDVRGLAAVATFIGANCPGLLTELGRPDEALERAASLSAAMEGSGNAQDSCEVRASELALRLARGGLGGAPEEIDWLISTGRTVRHAETQRLGSGRGSDRAHAGSTRAGLRVLAEVEQLQGVRESPYYARQLPAMIRTALSPPAMPSSPSVSRAGFERRNPLEEHAPARHVRNSPSTAATMPRRSRSIPRRPQAGRSSGTSRSAPTRCSAGAAACLPRPAWS